MPPHSNVLDAACGTGKYWPILLARGVQVKGIDQSSEMLRRASQKHPQVPVEKRGLQEIDEQEAFDGIVCIDAMENVFPEDWPRVLANFHRALKPGGMLYLTVELGDPDEIRRALQTAREAGLPVVPGEVALEGYHFYPAIDQVHSLMAESGFAVWEACEGDEYYHLLAQRP
jgi:cyclopropane fatty-acyl-phospholipid synthase-like methyltransferase